LYHVHPITKEHRDEKDKCLPDRRIRAARKRAAGADAVVVPGGTCTPEDRAKVAMPPEAEQARKQFFCGTTAAVVELMSTALEALVVDRTGLTGRFSFNIYSSPEAVGRLRPATPVSSVDPSLPSLPAAVREQLGFKVESTKSPVDVLVIDSVDPPTEN
jgi:uncharacterized protein (TIGR03435 family)